MDQNKELRIGLLEQLVEVTAGIAGTYEHGTPWHHIYLGLHLAATNNLDNEKAGTDLLRPTGPVLSGTVDQSGVDFTLEEETQEGETTGKTMSLSPSE